MTDQQKVREATKEIIRRKDRLVLAITRCKKRAKSLVEQCCYNLVPECKAMKKCYESELVAVMLLLGIMES